MTSREQAETTLRQDIEYAWEPWFNRDTVSRSQFSRAMRNAMAPTLIEQYKTAALVLLKQFIEVESIDMDELDELADKTMGDHAKYTGDLIADTTIRWVEDDDNPSRAFSRDRAELIAITEITRARTQGEMAAAALLEDVDIPLVSRWWTADDEHVCPVCGPLHKTPEKYWREFFPKGTPAHPKCRCEIEWKEKARRKSRRTKKVGRMSKRGRKSGFSRMRASSREEVREFAVLGTRLVEGGKGSGITGHRTAKKPSTPRAKKVGQSVSIRSVEESIRELDYERSVVMDDEGKVLFKVDGNQTTVTGFSQQQLKKLKGKTMTHNHPGGWKYPEGSPGRLGSSLSREDVALAVTKEVKEIRAVTPGYTHSLRIDPSFTAKEKALYLKTASPQQVAEFNVIAGAMGDGQAVWKYSVKPKVMEAEARSRKQYDDLIGSAKTPAEKAYAEGFAESNHWNTVWSDVAPGFGWEYSRTPWSKK